MTAQTKRSKPLVLMILDGFGISFFDKGNAVRGARMEHYESYLRYYPACALKAAGIDVGLPWGEVGNSEVGHKNIGSGRVIYQPLPQITLAVQDGSFGTNVAFQEAVAHVKERPGSSLHLLGLASPGGVHSHLDHLLALLDLAKKQKIGRQTVVHAFLDGRDQPPQAAPDSLKILEAKISTVGATLASLIGRYYAMDRNSNWDRTKIAYDLLVNGSGTTFRRWEDALGAAYKKKPTDEYCPPSVLGERGKNRVRDGDAVIFFNFRPDRARQLAHAFVLPNFSRFPVQKFSDLAFITMAEYEKGLPVTVAFPEEWADMPVGRVLADHRLRQLRIAETEKYAHVTYYFNSGRELPFPHEDRVLIPSPNVEDYATTPKMSAGPVTDRVVAEIAKGKYDVIVVNYANPDMIGHTGNYRAATQALQFLDGEIARVAEAAGAAGGAVLLTGDHGNAEEMTNPKTGTVVTDHSANPVPLIHVAPFAKREIPKTDDELFQILTAPVGVLADVGPTLLDLLGIPPPREMTAQSLLPTLL